MANKYKAESKAAQKQRVLEQSCSTKKRYSDPFAPVLRRGQKVYACQHCKGFHVSGLLMRLTGQGKRFLENRGIKP